MAIKIGSSSINSIYLGDTKVKSVYLGDKLVYSVSKPEVDIDNSYNYFVFDTTLGIKTVTLQNYRGGDSTTWNGITDWGDGTADTNLSHTYAKSGTYTVKTKYVINKAAGGSGDEYTRNMLTKCTNINKNITNCSYLFYYCKNLTYINTADFDTSNVTNMQFMFSFCESLTSLDLSNWNTSKVTDMQYMFNLCKSLTLLNLSNWDTSNVTCMAETFSGCSGLTSLDLSSFNTNKVIDMYNIFYNCYNLLWLYLTNWDMSNVTEYTDMFYGCNKLTISKIIMTNCNATTKTKIQNAFNSR